MVHSQQIISNTGASLHTSSGSIAFTIGEPVIATLSTTGGIITQGFHQTRFTITAIGENPGNMMAVKVYPNPASDILFVSIDTDDLSQIRLVLYDLTGNLLSDVKTDRELTEVDFLAFLPGTYILKVYKKNQVIGTYKIVKHK